eukprot:GILJ01006031.1.p1 GENE.GILJ01006031.1~~GILJ01006031.1.p1  ORF type:complete len:270 (-),score=42.24 GILJ01006031.1:55-864(-)
MAKRPNTSFSTTGKPSSPIPRRRHRVVQKSMEQQVSELVGIMSRHWAASGSKTSRKGYYEVDHQAEKTTALPIHDKFLLACGKTKTPEDIFAQQVAIAERMNKKPAPPKKKHVRAKSASLARLSQPLAKSTVPRRPSASPPVSTQSTSPSNSTHLLSSKSSVSGAAVARPKTSLSSHPSSFPPLPLSVPSALDLHFLPSPRLLLSSSIADSASLSDHRSTISELPKFDSQAILPVDRRFMLHQIPDYTKMTMLEISNAHTSILKDAASS